MIIWKQNTSLPKFYLHKIKDITYIRSSIMAATDNHNFDDRVMNDTANDTSNLWLNFLDKVQSEDYEDSNGYKDSLGFFESLRKRNKEYFFTNIKKKDFLEISKSNEEKHIRPAVYELLKIGEQLKNFSFKDLLFYDDEDYVPSSGKYRKHPPILTNKHKKQIEQSVDKFVNQYGALVFVNSKRKLKSRNYADVYIEYCNELRKKGYPVGEVDEIPEEYNLGSVVGTFLKNVEMKMQDICACLRNYAYVVDSPYIESPIKFSYKKPFYKENDKRSHRGKLLRGVNSWFDYTHISGNTMSTPFYQPEMSTDIYQSSFFPTHFDILNVSGKSQAFDCLFDNLYSEPVSLFLYAAKAFYLQVMYSLQIHTQPKDSVKEEEKFYIPEPTETYQYLKVNKIIDEDEAAFRLYPTYDILLQYSLNDIMQKNHHILICPLCGKVEPDRELRIINYSKIFCDDCGPTANMKLYRIKKNSPPEIKNLHNIIVRKALKEEVQALLNFYRKHAEIQVNNLEKVEIMRYGTEKQLAELFVAEIEGKIIGLSIKEPDESKQFEGCLLSLYLFSLILDKAFLHTNAFDIVINEVLKLNQKPVQAQYVSIIHNVCSVVEVMSYPS